MNSRPVARESQDAGFTQPRDHLKAHLCMYEAEFLNLLNISSTILSGRARELPEQPKTFEQIKAFATAIKMVTANMNPIEMRMANTLPLLRIRRSVKSLVPV